MIALPAPARARAALATAEAAAAAIDRAAYPFRSRWLDLPEGSIHYVDEGSGETLLFVHGTPSWSFEFRHLVAALRSDYRCIALDHLGFGFSSRPPSATYTPEAHSERLRAFVERLGLRDVTLIVHDYGGPIALPLAFGDDGLVSRVIVLNSWMWSFGADPTMARRLRLVSGRLGRWLYRWLNVSLRWLMPGAWGDRRKLTPAIHAQYLARFRDRDGRERVLWTLARALLASSAYFENLWRRRAELARIPALVVWGMRDPSLSPGQLESWRSALPHAVIESVPEAGHWPQEEAPGEVLAAIRRFLRA